MMKKVEAASHFSQTYSQEHERSEELSVRNTYKQGFTVNTSN